MYAVYLHIFYNIANNCPLSSPSLYVIITARIKTIKKPLGIVSVCMREVLDKSHVSCTYSMYVLSLFITFAVIFTYKQMCTRVWLVTFVRYKPKFHHLRQSCERHAIIQAKL